VCGWQVKLCDPLVTHGPYLSTLRDKGLIIKRYNYIHQVTLLTEDKKPDVEVSIASTTIT